MCGVVGLASSQERIKLVINKSLLAFVVALSLGSISGAHAQGPAGAGQGGAATISGSEVRAGESSRLNSGTVGNSTLTPETSTTAVTPNGTRVDTTIAPGGAVGSKAPDANAAAPAGR